MIGSFRTRASRACWRTSVIGLLLAALTVVPTSAASPVPTDAAASPGAERTYDACPVTVETAIDIGGEPLVPHEIYPGAPVFRPETIDGVSTYTCAYSAPGDPSVRQFTMTLSYSVDGSASTRWEVYVDGFLGPDNIPTDRVPGEAYERVWSADPGALEVAIDTRTATAFIQSNVAAYGTDHTLEQVRAMAEAWATAAVAALEPTSASSAP